MAYRCCRGQEMFTGEELQKLEFASFQIWEKLGCLKLEQIQKFTSHRNGRLQNGLDVALVQFGAGGI
jgi:hypothetical protein